MDRTFRFLIRARLMAFERSVSAFALRLPALGFASFLVLALAFALMINASLLATAGTNIRVSQPPAIASVVPVRITVNPFVVGPQERKADAGPAVAGTTGNPGGPFVNGIFEMPDGSRAATITDSNCVTLMVADGSPVDRTTVAINGIHDDGVMMRSGAFLPWNPYAQSPCSTSTTVTGGGSGNGGVGSVLNTTAAPSNVQTLFNVPPGVPLSPPTTEQVVPTPAPAPTAATGAVMQSPPPRPQAPSYGSQPSAPNPAPTKGP